MGLLVISYIVMLATMMPCVSLAQDYLQSGFYATTACWNGGSVVTDTPVLGPPTTPVTLFESTTATPQLTINCLTVVASNLSTLTAAQRAFCGNSAVLMLCLSLESSNSSYSFERNYVCSQNLTSFMINPTSSFTFGVTNGPAYYYKITWMPSNTLEQCFPRYLTTLVDLQNISATPSNLGIVITFVVIAAAVVAVGALFIRYHCRRHLEKLQRKISSRPPTTRIQFGPDVGDVDEGNLPSAKRSGSLPTVFSPSSVRGEAPNLQHPPRANVYGENDMPTRGLQVKEEEDGSTLRSRPMVKPWYKRRNYRGVVDDATQSPIDARGALNVTTIDDVRVAQGLAPSSPDPHSGTVPTGMAGFAAPPRCGVVGIVPTTSCHAIPVHSHSTKEMHTIDFFDRDAEEAAHGGMIFGAVSSAAARHSHRNQSRREPRSGFAEEDEPVAVCGDCLRSLDDLSTPALCSVTGKHHPVV
jgi:hypothetical protein